MGRPVWFVAFLKRSFSQRFRLARLTRLPAVGAVIDRWLFAGDDLFYLPRDQVIRVDQPLAPAEEMVLPSQVVEHLIGKASDHWIMNACICRDARGCEDYPVDLGCLFLGQATLGVNPRLGRRVTREEALDHVRRCGEAGLVHLIGRNKLDTVWLGIGPGTRLLTICHCCPCCCLWRMLPELTPQIAAKVARMPGVAVAVTERCIGCGNCTRDICFVGAIGLRDGRAVIGDVCRGCGRCVSVCPQQAIELSLEGDRVVGKLADRLSALVDLS